MTGLSLSSAAPLAPWGEAEPGCAPHAILTHIATNSHWTNKLNCQTQKWFRKNSRITGCSTNCIYLGFPRALWLNHDVDKRGFSCFRQASLQGFLEFFWCLYEIPFASKCSHNLLIMCVWQKTHWRDPEKADHSKQEKKIMSFWQFVEKCKLNWKAYFYIQNLQWDASRLKLAIILHSLSSKVKYNFFVMIEKFYICAVQYDSH